MKKLPSNGFGRIEQRIVLSVPTEDEESVPDDLDITLLDRQTSPPRTSYVWRRWTRRLADDEDVIFELSASLRTSEAEIDWQIDWEASVY